MQIKKIVQHKFIHAKNKFLQHSLFDTWLKIYKS